MCFRSTGNYSATHGGRSFPNTASRMAVVGVVNHSEEETRNNATYGCTLKGIVARRRFRAMDVEREWEVKV